MEKKVLVLIDGMNYLWRSFSVPFSFESRKGTPLHVQTMFLKLLRRTLGVAYQETNSNNISLVCAFDTCSSNDAREDILGCYKKNRRSFEEDEDSPYKHLPYVKEVLNYLEIKSLDCEGYEADDAINFLANDFVSLNSDSGLKVDSEGFESLIDSLDTEKPGDFENQARQSLIFSTDSDFYQCINDLIWQIRFKRKDNYELVTPEWIRDEVGITPEQYVDYKALKGDSADNISGVPGIGKVRAAKIINGDLDWDISDYSSQVERNRSLIRFREDVSVDYELGDFNRERLQMKNPEIFKACGF